MVPTAILACVFLFVAPRSRRLVELRPAALALCVLLVLDVLHHAAMPLAEAWRRGATLLPWQAWALRLDGVNVTGAWPGVAAWLLEVAKPKDAARDRWSRARAIAIVFIWYGVIAVDVARTWQDAWTTLRMAPRLAVGALAWAQNRQGRQGANLAASLRSYLTAARCHDAASHAAATTSADRLPPSLVVGKVIAACQVAAALFLWTRWGDVRLLSSACWVACGWVAWRARTC